MQRLRVFKFKIVTAAIITGSMASMVQAKVIDIDELKRNPPALMKGSGKNAVEWAISQAASGDVVQLSRTEATGTVVVGNSASGLEIVGGYDAHFRVEGSAVGWKYHAIGGGSRLHATSEADLTGSFFLFSFQGGFVDESGSGKYLAIGIGAGKQSAEPKRYNTAPSNLTGGFDSGRNIKIENFGDKIVFMPRAYGPAGQKARQEFAQIQLFNGDGGKFLFAIEAQQGNEVTALEIKDSKRVQLYSGSTEGASHPQQPVYILTNCNEVVLAMRRFFSNHRQGSSWLGSPQMGLKVDGGSGNIIHNLIEMSNPVVSMLSTDENLAIWNSFFEDRVFTKPGNAQFAVTYNGMAVGDLVITEPVQVSDEVILGMGGENILNSPSATMPIPPAFDFQPYMEQTPIWEKGEAGMKSSLGMPKMSVPAKRASTFGAALLAAGADPTGKNASDAAFAQVLTREGRLEIPRGTFLLKSPIAALTTTRTSLAKTAAAGATPDLLIQGEGVDATRLIGQGASVIDLTVPAGPTEGESIPDRILVQGLTLSGGEEAITLSPNRYDFVMTDFRLEGAGKAAVSYEDKIWFDMAANEGVKCVTSDGKTDGWCNDQHFFGNGEIEGFDYGVIYRGFADKQGYVNVTFKNLNKGGIVATLNNLFHGWISGCRFENIDGPGIDLSGGSRMPPQYGNKYYTQWVTMIEGCVFLECGNASRAPLDYGYADISMVANCYIKGTKPVKYGFIGAPTTISNTLIEVNASKAAMVLRSPRLTEGSRTPGTIIHTVKANGKVIFVDTPPNGDGTESANPADDFAFQSKLATDWPGENHSGPKWWQGGYDWVFPILIYNSVLDGESIGYELRNSKGFKKALKGGAVSVHPEVPALKAAPLDKGPAHDALGRFVPQWKPSVPMNYFSN